MQIVTDSGVSVILPEERMAELSFHAVPLKVSLGNQT